MVVVDRHLRRPSPLSLSPATSNPVLTAAEVVGLDASFIADPFMLPTARGWVMFFELLDAASDEVGG